MLELIKPAQAFVFASATAQVFAIYAIRSLVYFAWLFVILLTTVWLMNSVAEFSQ